MVRVARAACAALLLTLAGSAGAADAPTLAGNWKIIVEQENQPYWLLKLENKDQKWTATVTPADKVPAGTVENVTVAKDVLHFSMTAGKESVLFEFKKPTPLGDKLLGTMQLQGKLVPLHLERTKLTSLDPYEVDKDLVQHATNDPELLPAALGLLKQAGARRPNPKRSAPGPTRLPRPLNCTARAAISKSCWSSRNCSPFRTATPKSP